MKENQNSKKYEKEEIANMEDNGKVYETNVEKYVEDIQDEKVPFSGEVKERKLTKTKKGNLRKREDGYFYVNVPGRNGENRIAVVPKDTLKRLIEEGTSLRPLKDRYNTLSALTPSFDKPLMYYAIVAYNLDETENPEKWKSSEPLLKYEMVHLNGNLDDIRRENIRLTFKDVKLWKQISADFKAKGKIGADVEYARQREEKFKKQLTEFPNLKIMVRVIDPVKKWTKVEEEYNSDELI